MFCVVEGVPINTRLTCTCMIPGQGSHVQRQRFNANGENAQFFWCMTALESKRLK